MTASLIVHSYVKSIILYLYTVLCVDQRSEIKHAQTGGHPRYAELHCVSNFSFLRGASHPEELVERAHNLGYEALSITDECSLGVKRHAEN